MSEKESETKQFDYFELAVAILLGFAALGAAWSSYQSSMWSGKGVEAYGESSTMATKAAIEHNRAEMDIAHDYDCDLQAKEHILEAVDSTDTRERARHMHMASYLYAVEMTADGYTAMRLPPGYHTAGDVKKHEAIPMEALEATLQQRLGTDYENAMFARSTAAEEAAAHRFDEGRAASNFGDEFELDTVVFTVSLFFAGLGLVFKTNIRWSFFAVGAVVLLAATAYLSRIPWA